MACSLGEAVGIVMRPGGVRGLNDLHGSVATALRVGTGAIGFIQRRDLQPGHRHMTQTFKGRIGRTVHESTPHWPEPARPRAGAPNILVMLFDDVGFAHFGCYGSSIETPNIDRLAAAGLRYTNFHTTALCSPTRAALLTGRNHHSVGMRGLANWNTGFPNCTGSVAKSAGTLAEVLGPHGYSTFAVGKWHLTPMEETSAAGPFDQWPLRAASTASTASCRARPTSSRPNSIATIARSIPRAHPIRAITSPRI